MLPRTCCGPSCRQATASLDVERLRRELVRRASEVRTLLGQDIPRARKILRRLLVGRMECEASDDGRRVGYRFRPLCRLCASPDALRDPPPRPSRRACPARS